MAKKERSTSKNGKAHRPKSKPRSADDFDRGITTSTSFANGFLKLAGDIIAGRVTPSQGNAATGAGRNVLKVTELAIKYGQVARGGQKLLTLANSDTEAAKQL